MSAREILAGNAVVELGLRSKIEQGLKSARAKLQRFSASLTTVGRGFTRVGGGIAALGAGAMAPILAATRSFQKEGDAIHKMGIRTGATAEFLSEMGFAAEQSGTNIDQLGNALFRMNRRVANATTGTGPAVRALEELGISAEQLNQLSTEDRFLALSDALSSMDDQTRAAQLGFEIFGDSFKQLQPLINEGSEGIGALRQQAAELGITMTTEDANGAAAFGDALNRLAKVGKSVFMQIGAAMAPVLEGIVDRIVEVSKWTVGWVRENRALVVTIASIAAGFIGVGTAVAGVGAAIIAVGAAVSALGTLAGVISAVVASPLLPVIGIAAAVVAGLVAIGGAIAYVANEMGLLQPALRWVVDAFWQLFGTVKDTVTGIFRAIAGGNWGLAAQIAWAGVQLFTLQGIQKIVQAWEAFYDKVGELTVEFSVWLIGNWQMVLEKIRGMIVSAALGWSSLARASSAAVAEAMAAGFESGSFRLSDMLDPSIDRMEDRFNRLNAQARAGVAQPQQQQPREQQDIAAERRRHQQRLAQLNELKQRAGETSTDVATSTIDARAQQSRRELADMLRGANNRMRGMFDRPDEDRNAERIRELGQASIEGQRRTSGLASSGTFSAAAAAAMGIGSKPAEQTAKNTAALVGMARKQLKRQPAGPRFA